MSGKIMDELAGIDLGDSRLNQRSHQVIESLSVHSQAVDAQASINGSIASWTAHTRGVSAVR